MSFPSQLVDRLYIVFLRNVILLWLWKDSCLYEIGKFAKTHYCSPPGTGQVHSIFVSFLPNRKLAKAMTFWLIFERCPSLIYAIYPNWSSSSCTCLPRIFREFPLIRPSPHLSVSLLILYLLSCNQPSDYALGYIFIFLVWSLSTYSLQKKFGVALHHVQLHTHTHTHLVVLLWKSDRSVTETSTWHHTNRHPCPRRYSNSQSQQANGRRPTP